MSPGRRQVLVLLFSHVMRAGRKFRCRFLLLARVSGSFCRPSKLSSEGLRFMISSSPMGLGGFIAALMLTRRRFMRNDGRWRRFSAGFYVMPPRFGSSPIMLMMILMAFDAATATARRISRLMANLRISLFLFLLRCLIFAFGIFAAFGGISCWH